MSISPKYWDKAKELLIHKDSKLAKLIENCDENILTASKDSFLTLCKAIVGQQISIVAADSIYNRLLNLVKILSPVNLLLITDQQLKEIGLSRQKILYLKNIATHVENNKLFWRNLANLNDLELSKELLSIKGVGKWTNDMFLIFHMSSSDIFPIGDVGLVKAIRNLYGPLTLPEIEELSQQWRPYRTVATWYLWRSIDASIVLY